MATDTDVLCARLCNSFFFFVSIFDQFINHSYVTDIEVKLLDTSQCNTNNKTTKTKRNLSKNGHTK